MGPGAGSEVDAGSVAAPAAGAARGSYSHSCPANKTQPRPSRTGGVEVRPQRSNSCSCFHTSDWPSSSINHPTPPPRLPPPPHVHPQHPRTHTHTTTNTTTITTHPPKQTNKRTVAATTPKSRSPLGQPLPPLPTSLLLGHLPLARPPLLLRRRHRHRGRRLRRRLAPPARRQRCFKGEGWKQRGGVGVRRVLRVDGRGRGGLRKGV